MKNSGDFGWYEKHRERVMGRGFCRAGWKNGIKKERDDLDQGEYDGKGGYTKTLGS